MNFLSSKVISRLGAGFLSLGLSVSSVWAAKDVLETSSASTERGHQHLLLDVERTNKRLVAVGARGHILLSEDKGDSWKQVEVPVSVLLTAVDFADDENGWAVGHGGVILATNDGGYTWSRQFDGNAANQSIIRQAEAAVEALEARLESASEDEAADIEYELEEAQFGLEDAQFDAEVGASKPFLDVHFLSRTEGFAVGAYGFMFKTDDGGKTWQNYGDRVENIDRFHFNTITEIPGGALIVAGEAGVMFRSADDGETWETVDSPYDGSFFGLTPTGEADVVLAYGLRGNMFRSEDAGVSWDQVETNTESTLMGGSFDGSGKVSIVGNSGSVLSSTDSGRTFVESIRANRLGNVSLVFLSGRRMVVVGESGVSVTNPSGQNL